MRKYASTSHYEKKEEEKIPRVLAHTYHVRDAVFAEEDTQGCGLLGGGGRFSIVDYLVEVV
jgi:hypothetical protein